MKWFALLIATIMVAGCERDPYMARKGGYLPGEPYHHQSGLYPGITVSRAGA